MPVWNLKDVSSVHQSVKEGRMTLDLWPFTLSTADPPTALTFCILGLDLKDEWHQHNQEKKKTFWVFSGKNDMYDKSHELKWQPKRPIIHFSFYHLPLTHPPPFILGFVSLWFTSASLTLRSPDHSLSPGDRSISYISSSTIHVHSKLISSTV